MISEQNILFGTYTNRGDKERPIIITVEINSYYYGDQWLKQTKGGGNWQTRSVIETYIHVLLVIYENNTFYYYDRWWL